jgi:isopenicillin-N N-acyltransferase-like protein
MFPEVIVSGSPHERGRQYGATARGRVHRSIQAYAENYRFYAGWDWSRSRAEAMRFLPAIEDFAPAQVDELRGIADGAEVDLADIVAINVRTEFLYSAYVRNALADPASGRRPPDECSCFSATAAGRHVVVGQNWDWSPFALDTVVVLRSEPDDGPAFVTVVEAGLLTKLGVNEAGLALMTNALGSTDDLGEVGVPYHVLLRALIECEDVEAGLKRIDGSVRASSANYLLADAGGAAVDVESRPGDGDRVHVLDPDDRGVLLHTNHFVSPDFDAVDYADLVVSTTDNRLERFGELVDAADDVSDLALYERALADHANAPGSVCRHRDPSLPEEDQSMTVAAALVDLTDRRLLVAEGPPCERGFEAVAWPGRA